jgi:tetratricopeptide (TPR) repeat protein
MWDSPIDWNERFQKSIKLARQEQFAEALDILAGCVAAQPQRIDFANTFLDVLTRRNATAPTSAASAEGAPITPLPNGTDGATILADAEWLKQAPFQLVQHPHDIEVLYALTQAHLASGFRPVALSYVTYALHIVPKHLRLLRLKGRILTHLHRDTEAVDCWRQIQALQPESSDAVRAITHLVIHQRRQQFGWVKGESLQREATIPATPVVEEPVMPPEVMNALYGVPEGPIKLTPVQKLQQALRDSPSLPGLYLYIVPLYLEKGQDFEAEKLLHKGIEATGDDPQIRHLWENVSMMRIEKRIADLRQLFLDSESPQVSRELTQLIMERDELELKIFAHRAQREPENYSACYEWGVRLKRAGKIPDACRVLERLVPVETLTHCAAYELGECLEQAGDISAALQAFQKALDAPALPEQVEIRKKTLYAAGRLAKQIKLFRLAHRYYFELLQLDEQYADAAAQWQGIQSLLKPHGPVATKIEAVIVPPTVAGG